MGPMFYFGPSMEPKWPHCQEAKTALKGQNGPNKITVEGQSELTISVNLIFE